MTYFKLIFSIFILSLSFGCAVKQYEIKDLRDLQQNAAYYLDKSQANVDLLSSEIQKKINAEYNAFYFKPWTESGVEYKKDEMIKSFDSCFKKIGYGADKKQYTTSWLTRLFVNSDVDNYPNLNRRAITIRNTNLRLLPTNEAIFSSLKKLGQGAPFDILQNSSLGVNMPIFVAHISSDKLWVFVEASFASGWILASEIAFVEDDFVKKYMSFGDAVVISDDTNIYDENKYLLVNANIGCKFPLIEQLDNKYKILVALRGQDGNAISKEVFVDTKAFSSDYLKINMQNAAAVADKLLGQTYGWGGFDGYRDCSSMTKDYFSVFGLWVPRNSCDQAKDGNNYVDLSKLTKKQKKQKIIYEGVPFWTLIWMKGHIMLYIGSHNGEPIVFHNVWGLRVKKLFTKKYINLIGKSVITTLEPGKEISGIKTNILKKIQGMRVVSPFIKNTQKEEKKIEVKNK